MLIGLTLQDMKQVTSVASNITAGQELFRLVYHMLKSHKVSYVPITAPKYIHVARNEVPFDNLHI